MIMPVTATDNSYVIALATLSSTTSNRNGPISVAPPKVTKASKAVAQNHWRCR